MNRWSDSKNKSPLEAAYVRLPLTAKDLLGYRSLSACGFAVRHLQLRAAVLQEFNRSIEDLLPFVDMRYGCSVCADRCCWVLHLTVVHRVSLSVCSLPPHFSALCDGVRAVRDSIFFHQKRTVWEAALSKAPVNNSQPTIDIDPLAARAVFDKKKTDHRARHTMFGQVFTYYRRNNRNLKNPFAMQKNGRAFEVNYVGMRSTDAG